MPVRPGLFIGWEKVLNKVFPLKGIPFLREIACQTTFFIVFDLFLCAYTGFSNLFGEAPDYGFLPADALF